MASTSIATAKPPFYRDTRVIGIILQVLFALLIFFLGWVLYRNMITELSAINNTSGSPLSWNFLGQECRVRSEE